MLDKKQLKKLAGATIYNRGLDIHWNDGVYDFSVEQGDGTDRIEAQVQGSGRKRYQVSMEYDFLFDEFTDYYCNCPAFFNYSGLCKHCVATALEYIEYSLHQPVSRTDKIMPLPNRRRTASGHTMSPARAKDTTPALKTLLARRMVKRSLPFVQKEIHGYVQLIPTLKLKDGKMSMDFRIGVAHKYIIKDVFSFVENVNTNQQFSYGQKLSFTHSINAFAVESRPLVRYLCNWVSNNKHRYVQNQYYSAYKAFLPKLREIPLTANDLESFIELMGEKSFLIDIYGDGEMLWSVTEQELQLSMDIVGQNNGIELSVQQPFYITAEKNTYYFHKGSIYPVENTGLEQISDFLSCVATVPNQKLFIQEQDIPAFCRELLPSLEKHFRCKCENFDRESYGAVEVSFEIYLDAPQKDYITCRVMAVYGTDKYSVYQPSHVLSSRDRVREIEVGELVSAYFNAYDEEENQVVLAENEDMLYELLTHGIPIFQEQGEVFISDALKHTRVSPAPKTSLGISLSGELLELTMTAEDMPLEQLQEILSKYDRRRKFYRLKNGDFINMEGDDLRALLELKDTLGITDAQLKQGGVTLPKYRALYLDAESKEWGALSVTKNKAFRALVRNMKTVEDNDFELPVSLENILREYQKKGFLWLKTLRNNGFGGILADDMGLGKTLQVIAYLLSEYLETPEEGHKPVLVVCPASLVFNWSSEFERFAPSLPTKMVVGTAEQRREILETAQGGEILLTSYDLLKRDIACYRDKHFSCQIIDEAQYIKNHNTQVAKAVKEIQAGFKLALTGTPIENRLSELWSIFDYLMPGFLYSYQHFKKEYEMPIVQGQEEAPLARLRKMIRPFVLRRLKKDVLKDLPDKLEENMYVRLEGEQQELYDAHVQRLLLMLNKHSDAEFKKNKIQVLAELTKLRQICCDPGLLYEDYTGESAKTRLCVDMIKNAVSGGHKLLVFSQFTTMLSHLCQCLDREGIAYHILTGSTSKEQRRNLVDAFQRDDTPVFCISLKAGGTGLNLTAADMVLHYDPWWNLAVQNQATDRAHRIGQSNVVNVYKLIAKGTIEEKIIKLQDKKKELAEQLLGGEGMDSTDFSREELLELLV